MLGLEATRLRYLKIRKREVDMPNGKSDIMAQAVYLAQLEAAKNSCKCQTCRILRKATRAMTEQFLGTTKVEDTNPLSKVAGLMPTGEEALTLDDEED